MTVENLVKEIKEKRDWDKYLSGIVNVSYIPYETKIARCEQIINISSYIEINNKKVYRVNTPIKFVLTTLTLINEYTDIDIDFTEGNFLRDFNLLDQNELIEKIIAVLPRHEYDTWMLVLQMMSDDKQENERSLISYLDSKLATFNITLDNALSALSNLNETNEEEIVD